MFKLVIDLLPKQTIAWDYLESGEITELGYGGAAGGGKSYLDCFVALFVAKTFPGCRVGLGRKELKNLKATTLTTFFKIVSEQNLRNFIKYNEQSGIIYFANGTQDLKNPFVGGSEIVLIDTAHQPSDPLYTTLGGKELSGMIVDESNESPTKAIEILKTRVGRLNWRPEWKKQLEKYDMFRIWDDGKNQNGEIVRDPKWILKPFFLETFNPDKGRVYNDFYKPFKNGTEKPYRKFVPALPCDNPHLPSQYIESLKRSDNITRERLLYGNFDYDDDQAKLFNYDKILDIFTNFVEKKTNKYITCDVARMGRDKTVIYTWQGWNAFERFEIKTSALTEIVKEIEKLREKHLISKSNVIVDEGGVGGGVVDFGGYKGFISNATPIQENNKFSLEKKPIKNYNHLKTQCYFYLADMVNNSKMSITAQMDAETRENLIAELDTVKQHNIDKDGKLQVLPKDKQKELLAGRSPDDGDALMMRSYFDLKPTFKITIPY